MLCDKVRKNEFYLRLYFSYWNFICFSGQSIAKANVFQLRFWISSFAAVTGALVNEVDIGT